MNIKHYSFWLRFSFFLIVFAVAFFLILFVVDKNPNHNFRTLLIKIGVLATFSSWFYNLLIKSDPELVDWKNSFLWVRDNNILKQDFLNVFFSLLPGEEHTPIDLMSEKI